MIIGRLLGLVSLFVSLILFIKYMYYGVVDHFMLSSLGQTWYLSHRESLNALQAFIQRYLIPEIWDPCLQWVLLQPDWIVLSITGLILTFLFRKRT